MSACFHASFVRATAASWLVGNHSALGSTASPTAPPPSRSRQRFMEADQQQQQDEWTRSRHARLPTFTEVLSRRTRPPVDLFMF